MTLDRNKTGLTHRVTAIAAAYLDALGCKPVETEVTARQGWVADVAGYWYPTMTEAKKLHLHRRAQEILGDVPATGVIPRVYGHGPFTVLAEVKVSRSDFQKDKHKWNGVYPAHVCLLAFPAGVIAADEIPKGWYGLETSKHGQKLKKVHRNGCLHPQHLGLTVDFVAEVGIRRDHRTRYRALKDWAKAYRAEEAEKKKRYSAANLLVRLADWIQRKGWKPERALRDILPELGIKKVPQFCNEAIDFLESLRLEA